MSTNIENTVIVDSLGPLPVDTAVIEQRRVKNAATAMKKRKLAQQRETAKQARQARKKNRQRGY